MIITTDAISVSEIEEIYNDGDGLLTYAEENPDSGYFEIASAPLSFNASVQDYCYQERPNATDSADGVNCNLDYTGSEFASRLTDGANASRHE